MIPLVVCAYNMSYELLYTVLAEDKGQRLRNGTWFGLDLFIVASFIYTHGGLVEFAFFLSVMLSAQIVLGRLINKEQTKALAWFATLLMSVLMLHNLPTGSGWILAALVGKLIGDGLYGLAHLRYGVPGVEKTSVYGQVLDTTIKVTFALNLGLVAFYLL